MQCNLNIFQFELFNLIINIILIQKFIRIIYSFETSLRRKIFFFISSTLDGLPKIKIIKIYLHTLSIFWWWIAVFHGSPGVFPPRPHVYSNTWLSNGHLIIHYDSLFQISATYPYIFLHYHIFVMVIQFETDPSSA